MAMRLSIWLLGTVLLAGVAFSHHPFDRDYDRSKSVKLTGTVTKVEWKDPHTMVHMDVKDASGATKDWHFELGSPEELMEKGWSEETLKAGAEVTIEGWESKTQQNMAKAKSVTIMLDAAAGHDEVKSSAR